MFAMTEPKTRKKFFVQPTTSSFFCHIIHHLKIKDLACSLTYLFVIASILLSSFFGVPIYDGGVTHILDCDIVVPLRLLLPVKCAH